MQIPNIPTFAQGDSNIIALQQLSMAVSTLTSAQYVPIWRVIRTTTQSLSAGAWNTLTYTTSEYDSDHVFDSGTGIITINTQGYYAVESSTPVPGVASSNVLSFMMLFTAGGSNPHFSSGGHAWFGGANCTNGTSTTTDAVVCQADICPVVCYPGDTIVPQVYPIVACATDTMTNSGATQGWFAPQFSGKWIAYGS